MIAALTPTAEYDPEGAKPQGLGYCEVVPAGLMPGSTPQPCHGQLEVIDGIVACSRCRTPVPEHPISRDTMAMRKRGPEQQRIVDVGKMDNAPGYHERLSNMEKDLAELKKRVVQLEQRKK